MSSWFLKLSIEIFDFFFLFLSVSSTPDFRFIPEESGIRSNPLRRYCVPEDIAHLTSGDDPFKVMDLLKLRSGTQEDNADSDWLTSWIDLWYTHSLAIRLGICFYGHGIPQCINTSLSLSLVILLIAMYNESIVIWDRKSILIRENS